MAGIRIATVAVFGEVRMAIHSLEWTRPQLMRMRESIKRSLNYSGNLEIVKMWQG